jgi:hypothetical protein
MITPRLRSNPSLYSLELAILDKYVVVSYHIRLEWSAIDNFMDTTAVKSRDLSGEDRQGGARRG